MDKGVQNTHGGQITVSARGADEEDIVLVPGYNRLTVEQYRQIKAVPVVANYFKVGLLKDAAPPEVGAEEVESEDDGADDEKPLDRMNKAELLAKAESLGLTVDPAATNAAIRDAITAAQ